MADDDQSSTLEFFDKIDSIGIIVGIDYPDGNIKTEILDRVALSDDTLRKRLEKAIEAGLVKRVPIQPGDHGRSTRYQLTERGKKIKSLFSMIEVDTTYEEYVARKQELDDELPDLRKLIEAEKLHEESVGADYWVQSQAASERDLEQARRELRQGVLGEDTESVSVPDEDSEDSGTTEVWGTPKDDEDE